MTNLTCAAIAMAVLAFRFATPTNARLVLEAVRLAFPAC